MENRWKAKYKKAKNIAVDYVSTGSTLGVKRVIDGTFTIGFVHAPMTAAEKEKAKSERRAVLRFLWRCAPWLRFTISRS